MNALIKCLAIAEIIFFAANVHKPEKCQLFDGCSVKIAAWISEEKAVCERELIFVVVK